MEAAIEASERSAAMRSLLAGQRARLVASVVDLTRMLPPKKRARAARSLLASMTKPLSRGE